MNLENLNETQRQAVLLLESPLCILAGAGTGKTRVITHRIAHLVERGAPLRSIMGVTFTNKAAQEMRERIEGLLLFRSRDIQLGTFHSIASRWLRRLGHYVQVSPEFLIYDEDDAHRLMKKIATEQFNISKESLPNYLETIEKWQNQGLYAREVSKEADGFQDSIALKLYEEYSKQLLRCGGLDFNFILLKFKELLFHEDAFQKFCLEIKHFLVDEYQDTNAVQADIVHRIAQAVETVAIVGDDDQSIYGWRGANANNMQRFVAEILGTKVVKLEQNYRSTQRILDAANRVISNNDQRIGKSLFTKKNEGDFVSLMRSRNDRAEADRVIETIKIELLRGESLSSFAVLMRTNAQSRLFEEALRRSRMPFKLIGGVKFYDRKEIKDALATLRSAINHKSDIDFLRAINSVPRGVGDSSLEKIILFAKEHGLSLNQLCQNVDLLSQIDIPKRAKTSLHDFATALKNLGLEIRSLDAEEAVVEAIQISGLFEKYSQSENTEDKDRVENLHQLVLSARNFVEEAEKNDALKGALSFLEISALMSAGEEFDSNQDALSGAVTLMTLHSAKGLEFDQVFLVGLEEYGFPHSRALLEAADEGEIEEERRLCYVGMTRARKRLYLSYADQRMVFGTLKARKPSRFLAEAGLLKLGTAPETTRSSGPIRVEIDEEFDEFRGGFRKGMRVSHAVFGKGTILEMSGTGALVRASVKFDTDGSKKTIIATHLKETNGFIPNY